MCTYTCKDINLLSKTIGFALGIIAYISEMRKTLSSDNQRIDGITHRYRVNILYYKQKKRYMPNKISFVVLCIFFTDSPSSSKA